MQRVHTEAYARLGVDALKTAHRGGGVGIRSRPEGTSDVAVDDRKMSGNAHPRRWKTRANRRFPITLRSFGVDVGRNSIKQAVLEPPHQVFGGMKTSRIVRPATCCFKPQK